jgi:hypothetical protein
VDVLWRKLGAKSRTGYPQLIQNSSYMLAGDCCDARL